MRKTVAAIAAVSVIGSIFITAHAGATATYMSCGYPPRYSTYLEETLEGELSYRRHPRECYWSEDGSTAALINLVRVRWRHWGRERAYAHALRVDNHDMDRNGFQRHPVRVVLFAPRPAVGHPGLRRQYYTKLRIFDSGFTGVERLFRPGQPPLTDARFP